MPVDRTDMVTPIGFGCDIQRSGRIKNISTGLGHTMTMAYSAL
ncbi:MAG: hypothetical protein V7733_15355 [Paraglaciecola polaris]